FLNSHFQTGLRNVLDRAILDIAQSNLPLSIDRFEKVDEIPFDFARRLMSVIVKTPDGANRLICKGAPESVFACCDRFYLDGEILPMDPLLIEELKEEHDSLSAEGFRVLALAYADFGEQTTFSRADER